MKVFTTKQQNNVIFSWCPDIEESALNQAKLLAEQPFTFKHMALMPDAHFGKTMPIGGVLATKDVIIPDCCGTDIGCGMIAVKTSLKLQDFTDTLKEDLLHKIENNIPVGFEHNNEKRQIEIQKQFRSEINNLFEDFDVPSISIFENLVCDILKQLGTSGGGNHFNEIQYDENGFIWIMVHSGSRNIGFKICKTFDELAFDLNAKYFSKVPSEIHFLPINSHTGEEYLNYMDFALKFAYLNRKVIIEYIKKDIEDIFNLGWINFTNEINIHHNYVSLENHFGENAWVHRKGATLASNKTIGIIPGSMGTNSYIVRGLGNPASYSSCSHGAGRVMGRKEFNRQYNTPEKLREIEDSLKDVKHTNFSKEKSFKKNNQSVNLDVSESPQAYKNIEEVMNNQKDLVEILTTLKPIISVKG
jgi:tRNA-splicing ligase RtcB